MTRWLKRKFPGFNFWDVIIGAIIVTVVAAAGAVR